MTLIPTHQLELPETFQEKFLQRVFQIVKSAESALLLAPAGMGKTLTIRLIENQEFQVHHLPKLEIVCFSLDLLENPFEEISHLLESLKTLTPSSRLLVIADNAEAIEGPRGKDIVQKMKTLREKARPQISFILAAEKNILEHPVFEDSSGVKSILMENVLYLPPLGTTDSESFAQSIAKQLGAVLSRATLSQTIIQGGGAPRLIKRLVKLAQSGNDPQTDSKLKFDLETIQHFIQKNPSYPFSSPLLKTSQKPEMHDKIGPLQLPISLTKQEWSLAEVLIEAKGELVGREEMIKAIWPHNRYDTSEHALDQMIHRLKKKLETSAPPSQLLTLRGRGAKLVIQDE